MKKSRKSTASRRDQTKATSKSMNEYETQSYEAEKSANQENIGKMETDEASANNAEDLQIDDKDLINHIRAARVNFIIHSMGQICRVVLLPSYKCGAIDFTGIDLTQNLIVMEGIFNVIDSNSSNMILSQTEVLAVNKHNDEEQTIRFFEEFTKINLENVAWVDFPGHNLTLEGPQKVRKIARPKIAKKDSNQQTRQVQDDKITEQRDLSKKLGSNEKSLVNQSIDKLRTESIIVTDVDADKQSKTVDLVKTIKINDPAILNIQDHKDDSKAAKPPVPPNKQTKSHSDKKPLESDKNCPMNKSPLQDDVIEQQTPKPSIWKDFQFDKKSETKPVNKTSQSQNKNKQKTNSQQKQSQGKQEIDQAALQKSPKRQTSKNKTKKTNQEVNDVKDVKEIDQKNTSTFIDSSQTVHRGKRDLVKFYDKQNKPNQKQLLESLDQTNDNTRFDQFNQKNIESTYNWDIYTTQLNSKALTEDQIQNANKVSLEIEKQKGQSNPNDFDPEVDDGSEEANYSSVIRPQNNNKTDSYPITDPQQADKPAQNRYQPASNSTSLKSQLIALIGATTTSTSTETDLLKLPASSSTDAPNDPRSRTNSLRNGETSKVIQNINLDGGYIDKESYDDWLTYKKQSQQVDRKSSFEYFKEESKRLQQRMDKKGITNNHTGDPVEDNKSVQQTIVEPKPKQMKFTCFNSQLNDEDKDENKSCLLIRYTKQVDSNKPKNNDCQDEIDQDCDQIMAHSYSCSDNEDEDDDEEDDLQQNSPMIIKIEPRPYQSLLNFDQDLDDQQTQPDEQ